MKQDAIIQARRARDIAAALEQYGVKVPRDLSDALAAYDTADQYDPASDRPVVHTEALTIKASDVASLIDRAAESDLRLEQRRAAKVELGDYLARRANREATIAGAPLVEALAAPFDEAAEAFTEAWRAIPSRVKEAGFNDRTIRDQGSEAHSAVERAEAAASRLDHFNQLRTLVADSPVMPPWIATKYTPPPDRTPRSLCSSRSTGSRRVAPRGLVTSRLACASGGTPPPSRGRSCSSSSPRAPNASPWDVAFRSSDDRDAAMVDAHSVGRRAHSVPWRGP